jgi:hypothetical protein
MSQSVQEQGSCLQVLGENLAKIQENEVYFARVDKGRAGLTTTAEILNFDGRAGHSQSTPQWRRILKSLLMPPQGAIKSNAIGAPLITSAASTAIGISLETG